MATIVLNSFRGEVRAMHPALMADGLGVTSRNCKPGRGDLRPWRAPLSVATAPAGRQTIYRMGRDVASDTNYWLSWSTPVYAVRGFDANDTTERTYYTGDGAPKVTDNIMALASPPYPTTNRPMGLPAPTTSVTLTAGAGAGAVSTYFYTYTFVNDWGWESSPAPVSLQHDRPGDAVTTISAIGTPPAGNYGINRIRIYRTQATSSGSADFFFLREIATGVTTTTDNNTALGEVLPSTTWLTPPVDLSHLKALWNGMLAGISGGAVRFCEAYKPYAWPLGYDVVPPDSQAVALGTFGQSLLVLTNGRPLLVSGSGPGSMDQQLLDIPQSCIATRSAVSMGFGVAWASPDGLCFYGAGGARIVTLGIMLREDWQALKPETIVGKMYEGLYFGSYNDGSGRKGFVMDVVNPTGIYFLDAGYEAMHFDEIQDQLYILQAASVQRWDAAAPMMLTLKSKVFRLSMPMRAFACAEVSADTFPVTVKFYADGALVFTKVVTTRDPFRLPSGFYATDWQFEVATQGAVQQVTMAHSMQELGKI